MKRKACRYWVKHN